MAGHSKWASIKHKKATTDKKRSNVFGKLTHAITIAARLGENPQMNHELRLAIEKAKAENMPKENIKRAIAKGSSAGGADNIKAVTYEIYGPEGIAILAMAITDNNNRTLGEIKGVLNKHTGKLAASGSVSYLFERKGIVSISIEGHSPDDVEMKIIDSGADDYEKTENGYLVYTDPAKTTKVLEKFKESGIKIITSELVMEPKETVKLPDDESDKVVKLLEALDELDDISEVNSNLG